MSDTEKRPALPAKRPRPHGGWVTSPVRSQRHGKDGPIAAHHRALRLADAERKAAEKARRGVRAVG